MVLDRRLLIDALAYEVFSGEFTPACDPENREHTLGRLALETFHEGTLVKPREAYGGRITHERYVYVPTWAVDQGIISSVDVVPVREGDYELSAMTLRAQNSNVMDLTLFNPGYATNASLLWVTHKGKTDAAVLKLGDRLDRTRQTLAERAKEVFDSAN